MHDEIRFTVVIVLLTLLLVCCTPRRNGSPSSPEQPSSNKQEPEISMKLGKEEAIKKVQLFLDQHREGRVLVDLPYKSYETVRVPCEQSDVDTDPHRGDAFQARCQPIEGAPGAPYGSKSIEELKTKCCKPRYVEVNSLQPRWEAEYSSETDSWSVEMDFDVDAVKKVIAWAVNDDTGVVTEKEANK